MSGPEYTLDIVCTGRPNRLTGERGHSTEVLGQLVFSPFDTQEFVHKWPVDGGFIGIYGLRYLADGEIRKSFVKPRWRGKPLELVDGCAIQCPECAKIFKRRGKKLPITEINGEKTTALVMALRQQGRKEFDVGVEDIGMVARAAFEAKRGTEL